MNAVPRTLRVLVLSSHPVADTVGGELLLHRHISACPDSWSFQFHHPGDGIFRKHTPAWRLHNASRRMQRLIRALDAWNGVSLDSSRVLESAAAFRPDVILSIADGAVVFHALRLSRQLNCPLVFRLDDWTPGGMDVPERLRGLLEERFRNVIRASTTTLCICEEIRQATHSDHNTRVLPPIPGPIETGTARTIQPHLLFAGRFDHFLGPEMHSLIRRAIDRGHPERIRIIGPERHWDDATRTLILQAKAYGGMLKGNELWQALDSAGVLLVMAPFGKERSHLACYSFPCKIPEYCRHGRPIMVWGPEASTSVRWALRTGAARAVTVPDPDAVLDALDHWLTRPADAEPFATAAKRESESHFNPRLLQQTFEDVLLRAAGKGTENG